MNMCSLYALTADVLTLEQIFSIRGVKVKEWTEHPAIFPGFTAPVIRENESGEREMVNMHWGFILHREGYAPKRVFNVRDDAIIESAFWRKSFVSRRCLVPATSFCEPFSDVKPATWHWFALRGETNEERGKRKVGAEARPPFAFPGIWQTFHGMTKKDSKPVTQDVYSFLTTTPNSVVKKINHERMPVILNTEHQFETWLRGDVNEALTLAQEFPPAHMHEVKSGEEKEDKVSS